MSGESFELDVVSCCGFIYVEKSSHFGHLKSFFFKKWYKFSFHEQSVQRKMIVEMNILGKKKLLSNKKHRKVSTQKLSEEFVFS